MSEGVSLEHRLKSGGPVPTVSPEHSCKLIFLRNTLWYMHSGVKAVSEIVFWMGSHYWQLAKLVCSNMSVTWNLLGPNLSLKSLLHIVFFFQKDIASSAASEKQCLSLVNENISVSAYAVKYLVPGSLHLCKASVCTTHSVLPDAKQSDMEGHGRLYKGLHLWKKLIVKSVNSLQVDCWITGEDFSFFCVIAVTDYVNEASPTVFILLS